MARPVRYRESFKRDLTERVSWLRRHRSVEQRARLRAAIAEFVRRVAMHPGIGYEVERDGVASYRVFALGAGLPYVLWYVYMPTNDRGAVDILMLLHDAQDRERFDPSRFE